jgi:DNA-binding MarR family transcriptional regulator
METVPRIMRAIRAEMRRQGAPLLSVPQVRSLAFLHRSPGACLSDLAEHLGVSRPTASALVERLVKRGMVTRTTDPRERRRIVLTLTPLGDRHFRRTRRSTQAWMATVLAGQSLHALGRIAEGVLLLEKAFQAAAGGNGHSPRASFRPGPPAPNHSREDGPSAALAITLASVGAARRASNR